MITIKATGIEALREKLGDLPEPSPALAEAIRLACGVNAVGLMKASAIGAAWDHVQRAHEKCMAALNRRIVTEEDLATLGIKRLDGNP